jgi:hypothetical protein
MTGSVDTGSREENASKQKTTQISAAALPLCQNATEAGAVVEF